VTHRTAYVTKRDTLNVVFAKTTTMPNFIRRKIYGPTEAKATDRNPTPVTTVTIPYIKDTSETNSRILHPCNIHRAHKPITTLQNLLANVTKSLKTGTNPTTDRGQFTRSNAPTARFPTLV